MSNLKKNIFFAFGSQGLQLLRSILVSLLIPKTLGIEEFGFWQLFIFYTQYSGFLHLGLLDGIYLREGGKHYKELDFRSLGAQFRIFLIWQFIIIIPFIILGLNSSDINRTIIIISSCIYAIINNTFTFFQYILHFQNEIKKTSEKKGLVSILFILSVFALLLFRTTYFMPYVLCYIMCHLIGMLFLILNAKEILTNICYKITPTIKSELLYNFQHGFILMTSTITGMLILGFGRFLVDLKWGIKEFAMISFAFMFVNFFLMFVNQVSIVLFPELKRWERNKIEDFFSVNRQRLSFILPLLLWGYYAIEVLINIWLPKYHESIQYLVFLLPLCVFDIKMNLLCNTLFKVTNKIRHLMVCNIFALLVSILFITISVYVCNSMIMVVTSMLSAIIIRSIVAEFILTKILDTPLNIKEMVTELALVAIFIVCNTCFNTLTSAILYGLCNIIRFVPKLTTANILR